ncbi:MAG: PD-(D/E)XK nuclease family protein, partial [Cyclobacteriaceae bacterium]
YPGMIYRKVASEIAEVALPGNKPVVFAGFNALSRSEEQVMSFYIKERNASVFWDADQSFLDDPKQEAGVFLRRYMDHPVFKSTFDDSQFTDMRNVTREVTLLGVPHDTGQAKKAGEILHEMAGKNLLRQPEKTVVVLADEAMLFPVLYSLPSEPEGSEDPLLPVNVTMGYPLRETSLYGLLEQLVEMHERAGRRREADAAGHSYHYRHIISILRHPLVYHRMAEEADAILQDIQSKNLLSVSPEEFTSQGRPEQMIRLFKWLDRPDQVIPYLLDILKDIRIHRMAGLQPTGRADLELEYVFAFESHLKRLGDTLEKNNLKVALDTFLRLYRNLARFLKVPFSGEPLNGLQIMGMLETRNLDFDHVIVLNMNEGVFPPVASSNSYVPYALRRAFGLSTPEHADAVSASVFYGLLQRAGKVTLLYNATISSRNSGGMSRFLYQLMFEKPEAWKFSHGILSNPVVGREPVSITIRKTENILDKMGRWLRPGDAGETEDKLTASALNAYLDCRLRFYFRYVARLKESQEVEEEIDQRIFGNILHEAMELHYDAFTRRKGSPMIEPADFDMLKKNLPESVEQAFQRHYGSGEKEPQKFRFEGRNIIARDIILQMASKVLEKDREDAPFEIIGLEKTGYTLDVPVSRGTAVLTGIIDRVDRRGEQVRVIDYKTGKDNKQVASIESLFDRDDPKRNKAALQTFLYGYLYKSGEPKSSGPIMAGLYNVKELFKDDFSMMLTMDKKPITDVSVWESLYMEKLTGLLDEVFDPVVDFDQTDDEKKCRLCPYNVICHRG